MIWSGSLEKVGDLKDHFTGLESLEFEGLGTKKP